MKERLMECAALCLLTVAVGFRPAPSTTSCSYCVDARSTYQDCFDDVLECAYRDPKSLIFCLNTYEKSKGEFIEHSLKCISYAEFYVSNKDILGVTEISKCDYNHVQKGCHCDVCGPKNITTSLGSSRIKHKLPEDRSDGKSPSGRQRSPTQASQAANQKPSPHPVMPNIPSVEAHDRYTSAQMNSAVSVGTQLISLFVILSLLLRVF